MDDDNKLAGKSGIDAELVLEGRADDCWQAVANGGNPVLAIASALFASASALYALDRTLGDIEVDLGRLTDALEAKET